MIKHEDKHRRVNIFINKTLRGALLETGRPLPSALTNPQEHRLVRLAEPRRERGPFGKARQAAAPFTFAFFFPIHSSFQTSNWSIGSATWVSQTICPGVHDIKRTVRAAEAPFIRRPRQTQDLEEHGSVCIFFPSNVHV